jgi:hypothetical protein
MPKEEMARTALGNGGDARPKDFAHQPERFFDVARSYTELGLTLTKDGMGHPYGT